MNRNFLPRVYDFPADKAALDRRLQHAAEPDPRVVEKVRKIIRQVRRDGIKALVEWARRLDGVQLTPRAIALSPARLQKAWDGQPLEFRNALRLAKGRIEVFHRRQRREGWTMTDKQGARLTQRVLPLRSVGVYVPNAQAPLFSTVLMTVIPAQVAGVKRIVAVTPPIGARANNDKILAALHLCGVREVFQAGGAVGVAALAFGAGPIPAVDKVVGPGNIWAQTAKRLLFGVIDIDMEAGPTEVLVLADHSAPPNLVAADMISQAEHAEDASAWAILIGPYDLKALQDELRCQTANSPRQAVIEQSLKNNGAIVRVKTRAEAVALANERAPEHLAILARAPEALADKIVCAGAIFLGRWTPEPIGDYVAGPNHTLPTGRSARFFSALSVDDFVRTDHMVSLSEKAFRALAPATIVIGEAEGLYGHAQAVRERLR